MSNKYNNEIIKSILGCPEYMNNVRLLTDHPNKDIDDKITALNITEHPDMVEYDQLYRWLNDYFYHEADSAMLNMLYILYLKFDLTPQELLFIILNEFTKYTFEDEDGIVLESTGMPSELMHTTHTIQTIYDFLNTLWYLKLLKKQYSIYEPKARFNTYALRSAIMYDYRNDYQLDNLDKYRLEQFCNDMNEALTILCEDIDLNIRPIL